MLIGQPADTNPLLHGGLIGSGAGAAPSSTLLNGLTAYWALSEATGTRYDSTSNHIDLSATNSPGNAVGPWGNWLNLIRANGQYCSAASAPGVTLGTNPFEIVGWVQFKTASIAQGILTKYQSGNLEWLFYTSASGHIGFGVQNPANTLETDVASAGTYSVGVNYFLDAWYDGASLNLSINNAAPTSVAYTAGCRSSSAIVAVGQYDSSFFLDGYTGPWAVYNSRNLTASERTEYYSGAVYPFS